MDLQEAVTLSNQPPRVHMVRHGGDTYVVELPAQDDGVYYTGLFSRRLHLGLISGGEGVLAGAYAWRKL